jgi:flagellar basal-body rod protein FlgC
MPANAEGYVKLSNANVMIESLDMKEAIRAYQANISVIENADAMESSILGILKTLLFNRAANYDGDGYLQ